MLPRLPRDIIDVICRHISGPESWKTLGLNYVSKICSANRCWRNTRCTLCESVIPIVNVPGCCTQFRCVKYRYKCDRSRHVEIAGRDLVPPILVRWDTAPLSACTPYRCILSECDLCSGPLRASINMQLDLCAFGACSTYISLCAGCDEPIFINNPDPKSFCTLSRCIRTRCPKCGGHLRYGPEDTRKLCDLSGCQYYTELKCTGGHWLRSDLKESELPTNCTQYRCVDSRCVNCLGPIAPYKDIRILSDNGSRMCTLRRCTVIEDEFIAICKTLECVFVVPDYVLKYRTRIQYYRRGIAEMVRKDPESHLAINIRYTIDRFEKLIYNYTFLERM